MLERRNNHAYYYKYQKCGRRSRRIYVAAGAQAEQAAAEDARDRAARALEAEAWAATRTRFEALDETLEELHTVVRLATHLVLNLAGFHQHDRGAWRQRRTPRPDKKTSGENAAAAN